MLIEDNKVTSPLTPQGYVICFLVIRSLNRVSGHFAAAFEFRVFHVFSYPLTFLPAYPLFYLFPAP